MAVKIIKGDLLNCGADIICHQTNFFGMMGGGVAASIWNKLLDQQDRKECTTVYFCKGWEQTRGCRMEHDAAVAYGMEILYEDGAAREVQG